MSAFASRRAQYFNTLLLLILAFAMTPSFAAPKPKIAATREWTVMVYMNAKNNLEPDALSNFYSMAKIGSTPQVAIVAELGRPSSFKYTKEDGGWSGVYRFYVKKGSRPDLEDHPLNVASLNQSVDMGKPAALTEFIRWAKTEFPAKRYMLVIWNHGQGWRFQLSKRTEIKTMASRGSQPSLPSESPLPYPSGYRSISSDDDTGSILHNREVQDVISNEFGKKKLDLLGFDACLMSMIETAYAFSNNTNVMVASEELEPGSGWRYDFWLEKLIAKPEMTAEQLATEVVDAYSANYENQYLTTQSALALTGVRSAAKALSIFANNVRTAGAPEIEAFRKARKTLTAYGASINPPLTTSVDLITLLRRFENITLNPSLKNESSRVRSLLSSVIIKNYASSRSADRARDGKPYGSEGLAVYFPESENSFYLDRDHVGYTKENLEHIVDFVHDETWSDLLYKILDL